MKKITHHINCSISDEIRKYERIELLQLDIHYNNSSSQYPLLEESTKFIEKVRKSYDKYKENKFFKPKEKSIILITCGQ